MAANTTPIYSKSGDNQWAPPPVLAANTTKDLTSGTIYLVYTAPSAAPDADGGFVSKVVATPLGTNVATVMRLWENNGSTTATATNNTLLAEQTCPATTVSEVAAQAAITFALSEPIKAGHRLYVTVGTVVAAGFDVTAHAGKY